MGQPTVYILTNRYHTVFYTGVTGDLSQRMESHLSEQVHSFTRTYRTKMLVYAENHSSMYAAISREKQIKNWKRAWKVELIESLNPDWRDLSQEWL